MPLPRLLTEFMDAGCFTLEEAAASIGKVAAREDLKYLRSRGDLENPRRGLYVIPATKSGKPVDRYVLASKVAEDGVLSYHTALELHGVAHSAIFNVVYIATTTHARPFTYQGTLYRPVRTPEHLLDPNLTSRLKRSGTTMRFAGRELSLVQCLDRLHFAGGFEEVLHSVSGLRRLNWEKLAGLLGATPADAARNTPEAKVALLRKVGFVLELNARTWDPPRELLDLLERRVRRGVTYFGTTPKRGGRFVPRWRVIVPGSIAEEAING